ncbi:oligosaccharide repeat unit polymerase [uncultured Fibrella sp.]|uniref:oligosaccharide repeat unit polymerase n=1 Tax=uncultured Fibrella sp. TaxID=1284596 RepID=UPI0035C9EC05
MTLTLLFGIGLRYVSELSNYEVLAFSFSLFTFLNLFIEFGNSIALRELMGFVASLQLLLSTALEFVYQPEEMPLPSDEYFSYALPAVVAYYTGLFLPIFKTQEHVLLLSKAKTHLIGKDNISTILLVIGIVGAIVYQYVPIQIKAIVYLFSICLYASVMYGHYLSGKIKRITLSVAFALLVYTTIKEGAFGHLIFWTTLYFIIAFTGTDRGKSLQLKSFIVLAGIVFIVIVQSVKMDYRLGTWGNKITERRADPELLMQLVKQRIDDPSYLLSREHFLSVAHRFNQGNLVALAQSYVPRVEPYADGEILFHFVYPIIPRLFWNEKPITGGVANITRFTPLIHSGTSSSNISPFGEAYANFGIVGGIVFMFIFGLLFNYCFSKILRISENKPSLLLWLPCLFSGCLTVETDVLSMWGSFISTSIFIAVFWFALKRLNINL